MTDKLNCAVCFCCGEILHSRHRHDFVMCKCPNESFVDGGSDYCRSGGKNISKVRYVNTMAEARRISAGVVKMAARRTSADVTEAISKFDKAANDVNGPKHKLIDIYYALKNEGNASDLDKLVELNKIIEQLEAWQNSKCKVTKVHAEWIAASAATAEKARLAREKVEAERAAAAPPVSTIGDSAGLPHGSNLEIRL